MVMRWEIPGSTRRPWRETEHSQLVSAAQKSRHCQWRSLPWWLSQASAKHPRLWQSNAGNACHKCLCTGLPMPGKGSLSDDKFLGLSFPALQIQWTAYAKLLWEFPLQIILLTLPFQWQVNTHLLISEQSPLPPNLHKLAHNIQM